MENQDSVTRASTSGAPPRYGLGQRSFILVCTLLALSACDVIRSGDRPSAVPGTHWHYSGGGDRFLVETKTGTVLYWMFENGAGSCTAQSKIDPVGFTKDFVNCDDAVKAIEAREIDSAGPSVLKAKP